jgi:formate-dependent nitrite reductase membrane component NrfD
MARHRRSPDLVPSPAATTVLIAPQLQRRWDVPHATWFSLMGIGGGVFLVSRLLALEMRLGVWVGLPVVDLISFAAIAIGGLILIVDLGRPMRFARAVMRPGTSWISRGAIADFIFLLVGGALIAPGLRLGDVTPLAWLPWDAAAAGTVGRALEWVALLSAAVVIFYAGQVLADGTAIPYWRSPAIPLQFVLSSLATSVAIVMVLHTANGDRIPAAEPGMLVVFLALLLVAVGWHLRSDAAAPGKTESLDMLLRGAFRWPFLAGVVAAGTAVPMLVAGVSAAWPATRDAAGMIALVCTTVGGFGLRLITLRVGIYAPLPAFGSMAAKAFAARPTT